MRVFHGLASEGKLPENVKEYLHKAWKEIEDTECYKDYGMPREFFKVPQIWLSLRSPIFNSRIITDFFVSIQPLFWRFAR